MVRFEMIGGKTLGESRLHDEIESNARRLPNLRFRGFIPFHLIDEFFGKASIFVNTSTIEGFPNTFIQAWMCSTPVVSLNVDPDGIIRKERLGFCSGEFKRLLSDVVTLLENETLRKALGVNARRYVEREHDVKKAVSEYIRIFEEVS